MALHENGHPLLGLASELLALMPHMDESCETLRRPRISPRGGGLHAKSSDP